MRAKRRFLASTRRQVDLAEHKYYNATVSQLSRFLSGICLQVDPLLSELSHASQASGTGGREQRPAF